MMMTSLLYNNVIVHDDIFSSVVSIVASTQLGLDTIVYFLATQSHTK